jgi:hypothetical protein
MPKEELGSTMYLFPALGVVGLGQNDRSIDNGIFHFLLFGTATPISS